MKVLFSQLMRSSAKRSTVLLITLTVMIIWCLRYDVTYPYEATVREGSWLNDLSSMVEENGGNTTCSNCNFYDVSGFAKDLGYTCVKTSTRPSTTVCVYNEYSDIYISHDLIYTGVWEPQVLKEFQEILSHNRDSGFIDLGANIGFYSSLAAKMGHHVIAVEPYRESIYRIHRALYLEELGDRVTVLENGISDKPQTATLRTSGNNQGDNQIQLNVRPCAGSCPTVVNTVTLDNLVPVIRNNFSSAILKLDIQGFEHRAFEKAHALFDAVDIRYILMEWFVMKGFYVDAKHTSSDKFMVEQMLRFLFHRDYRPYSLTSDGGLPLDPSVWYEWPFDIVWRRKLNDTEKVTAQSNHFRIWPPT